MNISVISEKNIINKDILKRMNIFPETITLSFKPAPSGYVLNAIRHCLYKEDYCYYLDCSPNDIVADSESIFLQKRYIIDRLNSIPIIATSESENVGYIKISTNLDKQFFDIKTSDIQFRKDSNIQIDKEVLLYQLPYGISKFTISSIQVKKGYSKNSMKFNTIHNVYPEGDKIIIQHNGNRDSKEIIKYCFDSILKKCEKKITVEEENGLILENEDYVMENLLNYYGLDKYSFIIKRINNNLLVVGLDKKQYNEIISNIKTDFNKWILALK